MRGFPVVVLVALLAMAAVAAPAAPTHRTASTSSPSEPVALPGQPGTSAFPPDDGQNTSALAPIVSVPNTTNYLGLSPDDVQTEGFGTVTVDVSAALASETGRLDAAFSRHQLRAAYANANTDVGRITVLRAARNRVASSVDDLESRERAALEAYNAGDVSAREYLRELAVIDARSEELQPVVQELERLAGRVEDPPVTDTEIARLKSRLISVQGPVRDEVGQVLAGEGNQTQRVYVETSSDGIVLATVIESDTGPKYIREAYAPSNRRPGAPDSFDGNYFVVVNRLHNLYPWTFTLENFHGWSVNENLDLRPVGVYRFTISHDHGHLTTFFDGGSNTTFMEYQRKTISAIPTRPPVTNISDGLRMQVNRTRTGGPLEVRVVDNATGAPVDGRITIDGEVIGRTGGDGRLWTIGPPARFTVNATTADGNVSVDTFSRRSPE